MSKKKQSKVKDPTTPIVDSNLAEDEENPGARYFGYTDKTTGECYWEDSDHKQIKKCREMSAQVSIKYRCQHPLLDDNGDYVKDDAGNIVNVPNGKTEKEAVKEYIDEVIPKFIHRYKNTLIAVYVIVHDQDMQSDGELKYLHIHLVLIFNAPMSLHAVMKALELTRPENLEPVVSVIRRRSCLRYLCHMTDKAMDGGKHVYPMSDVHVYPGETYTEALLEAEGLDYPHAILGRSLMSGRSKQEKKAIDQAREDIRELVAAGRITVTQARERYGADGMAGLTLAMWEQDKPGLLDLEQEVLLKAQDYYLAGHPRCLTTYYIQGPGGVGKDILANALANECADARGIHQIPTSARRITNDPAQGYCGQRVAIATEAVGRAFGAEHFESMCDPLHVQMQPSRNKNRVMYPEVMIFTSSTDVEQFIYDIYAPCAESKLGIKAYLEDKEKAERRASQHRSYGQAPVANVPTLAEWQQQRQELLESDPAVANEIVQERRRIAVVGDLSPIDDDSGRFILKAKYRRDKYNTPHCRINDDETRPIVAGMYGTPDIRNMRAGVATLGDVVVPATQEIETEIRGVKVHAFPDKSGRMVIPLLDPWAAHAHVYAHAHLNPLDMSSAWKMERRELDVACVGELLAGLDASQLNAVMPAADWVISDEMRDYTILKLNHDSRGYPEGTPNDYQWVLGGQTTIEQMLHTDWFARMSMPAHISCMCWVPNEDISSKGDVWVTVEEMMVDPSDPVSLRAAVAMLLRARDEYYRVNQAESGRKWITPWNVEPNPYLQLDSSDAEHDAPTGTAEPDDDVDDIAEAELSIAVNAQMQAKELAIMRQKTQRLEADRRWNIAHKRPTTDVRRALAARRRVRSQRQNK